MSVFKVNGYDLTQYLNKDAASGMLSGSSRQISLKRQILHDVIQRLPEDVIERIFDDNNIQTKWIQKISDPVTGEPETDEWFGPLFVCDECNGVMIEKTPFCPYCGSPKTATCENCSYFDFDDNWDSVHFWCTHPIASNELDLSEMDWNTTACKYYEKE